MIDYDQNTDLIRDSILAKNPHFAFEKLILSLSKNGNSKTEIYYSLEDFHLKERDKEEYKEVEKKYNDHPIEIAMDRLCDWCHKDARLLTNEIIEKK